MLAKNNKNFFLIITLEFGQGTIIMAAASTMEFVCKERTIDIMWMNICISLKDVRHDSD